MQLPAWVSATETRLRKRTEAVQTWVERTIWWRVWERVLENEFVDRSVALAAKAFVSLFPAIIVIAAFAPASVRDSDLPDDHAPSRLERSGFGDGSGRLRVGR